MATRVELLYLAHNRLEFTRESFSALALNTDWSRVDRLHVYDDASTDGTREYLRGAVSELLVSTSTVEGRWGSSVAPMVEFIGKSEAEIVGKIDNDTMLPPGWLGRCLKVMESAPELDLLGVESFTDREDRPGYRPARFIGGIGLFRRRAFRSLPRTDGRFHGFTTWQERTERGAVKGWIAPPLPAFLLDRIPFDPWRSLSERYVRDGVQRHWPPYDAESAWMWEWWKNSSA
jgi:GT2 family glycosyltransferase